MARNEKYADLDDAQMEAPTYGGDRGGQLPRDRAVAIPRARLTAVIEKDGSTYSGWEGWLAEFEVVESPDYEPGQKLVLYFQTPEVLLSGLPKTVKQKGREAIVKRSTYNFRAFVAACFGKRFDDPKLKVLALMAKMVQATIDGDFENEEDAPEFAVAVLADGRYFNTSIGVAGSFKAAKAAAPGKTAKPGKRGVESDDDDDQYPNR